MQFQGDRPYNEDRYTIVLPDGFRSPTGDTQAFFAVYDGHGSSVAADHAAQNLHNLLLKTPELREGRHEDAIKTALAEEDHLLLLGFQQGTDEYAFSGSTVALCFVDLTHGTLAAANLGDSHAVLAEYDPRDPHHGHRSIKRLTKSHEPTKPSERHRIEEAGGKVHKTRIGALNMSRALGDLQYKNPTNQSDDESVFPARRQTTSAVPEARGDFLSSEPHVSGVPLEPDRSYILILITDGVTHYMDDGTILDKTLQLAADGLEANGIAEQITAKCGENPGSDNATCIIALFKG